jgi:hypothetical protein
MPSSRKRCLRRAARELWLLSALEAALAPLHLHLRRAAQRRQSQRLKPERSLKVPQSICSTGR